MLVIMRDVQSLIKKHGGPIKCNIVIIFIFISPCYSTIQVSKCRCYVNESIGMAVRHADSIRERS